jgi:hypothetical protein
MEFIHRFTINSCADRFSIKASIDHSPIYAFVASTQVSSTVFTSHAVPRDTIERRVFPYFPQSITFFAIANHSIHSKTLNATPNHTYANATSSAIFPTHSAVVIIVFLASLEIEPSNHVISA